MENELPKVKTPTPPVSFVPTPTNEYRVHRKTLKATVQPGLPIKKIPIPIPRLVGPRVLIYKQDPSVAEIGVRKVFLPGYAAAGPRDARITYGTPGLPPVSPNAFGDFIQTPGTDVFDAVHTFAVVRMTLNMYQRVQATGGVPAVVPWQWNSPTNTDPLNVFPHAGRWNDGIPGNGNSGDTRNGKGTGIREFRNGKGTGIREFRGHHT